MRSSRRNAALEARLAEVEVAPARPKGASCTGEPEDGREVRLQELPRALHDLSAREKAELAELADASSR